MSIRGVLPKEPPYYQIIILTWVYSYQNALLPCNHCP